MKRIENTSTKVSITFTQKDVEEIIREHIAQDDVKFPMEAPVELIFDWDDMSEADNDGGSLVVTYENKREHKSTKSFIVLFFAFNAR